MGNATAQGQAANDIPPVIGAVMSVTLDATSRRYDLGQLLVGGLLVDLGGDLMLTMRADVRFFYAFSPTNVGTVDGAGADAAGAAPLTFGATYAADANLNERVRIRINRKTHRWLVVKGSGAGVLRMWASSHVANYGQP